MTAYQVDIRVVPRAGILDPQGKAVGDALRALGFTGLGDVHVGRVVTLSLQAESEAEATARVDAMCRQLLANPVTEDYHIELHAAAGGAR